MPFGLAEFNWTQVDIPYTVWLGIGGSVIVLLQSVLSEQRRTAIKLFAGCLVGGAAAGIVGHTFADSAFVYVYVLAAAVMAEHVLLGLSNLAKQFSDQPLNVFAQLWRIVAPGFGKVTDRTGLDLPDEKTQKDAEGSDTRT